MKKFIGLLSVQDAEVLERYARGAKTILEFGAGGSTHIFAQTIGKDAKVISFESEAGWIARTRSYLSKLGVPSSAYALRALDEWSAAQKQIRDVDLIFVDGKWPLRQNFAMSAWPLLKAGGHMLFHDTRRQKDIDIIAAMVSKNFLEIANISANEKHAGKSSNTTAIRKKVREPEVNWYRLEGKPKWAYGIEPNIPSTFWDGK